jgi:hypothetical protein
MGDGESRPLLNTFLYPSTVAGTHTQILSILILALVMASTLPSPVHGSTHEPVFATMYDVMIFDSSCLNSTSCAGEQVEHLVEYYGADWCEPCILIEEAIDLLNRTDTFVMQHHPSVADASFLSASKLRFENEHRLLFLPSIVVDGKGLLTGSSQGLELSNVLSQRSTSYEGLSEVELVNGSLTWQASQGDRVSVWRTEAMEHPNRNRTHPSLATGMMKFNASNGSGNVSSLLENFNGSLVVVLEQTGVYQLVSDSLNPTGGVELYDESEKGQIIGNQGMSPGQRASLWTGILVAALAPAIYMRWNLSKQAIQEEE